TKCRLSGPVSGTAAGRLAYQCAGSISIHAALARLARPKMPSAQNQGSPRSLRAIAPPSRRPIARGRAADALGTTARRHLADRAREPGDALGDGRLVDRGAGQRDVLATTTVGEEDLAAGVGDARGEGRLVHTIRVGAGGEREPDHVPTTR